ncbi:adenylate/guanylate cyclase domain-containing protein [Massilia glaciei]|uniref:Adenylate/guanylate cyclase domain-containing protein n=1 Tax=Massilia glaciei TaxID=1524097 RepID=A0A2U2HNB5_9BURK|nr:adenylate/guanylate cyclase domain-containing protein [Massilia glaciei]PWF49008.1 adenylate/guanylate cyclase domain-containing protein [Massilia glaciei]
MHPQPPSARRAGLIGWLAVALASVAALALAAPALDARILDLQFAANRHWHPQPAARDVVVVGINEAFLDSVDEPLALSHKYLAEFMRAVGEAGPAVIGMDIELPAKRFDTLASTTDPGFDFHRTLVGGLIESMRNTKLVLAKTWDYDRNHYRDIQIDYAAVLGAQEGEVRAIASAMVLKDADGRVRRYPGASVQPDRRPFTLVSEMAAAAGVRRAWRGLINYQIGGQFPYIALQDVLRLARDGETARLRALFAGRVVLIGTVQDEADLYDLPVPLARWRPDATRVPGVLLHAQIVRTMLNGGFITPIAPAWVWGLSLLFTLSWFHRSVAYKGILLACLALGLVLLSTELLRRRLWLPPAGILLCASIGWLARGGWQAWQGVRENRRLSRSFSGFVSPSVMKEILAGRLDGGLQGSKRHICVLFSDIRDFTGMSEPMPAEDVVALLNRYFGRMAAVVHRHGGTVDKFIGDGMMAFFNAPNALADPERAALRTARDMLDALAGLNAELAAEGRPALAVGIGLHSGLAVIGNVGSPDRHEFTAIGDTVNIAARVEAMCKPLGYPVVCSEAVAAALGFPPDLVGLGEHQLKGRRAGVGLYGLDQALAAARL